jgi:hypothetical protein
MAQALPNVTFNAIGHWLPIVSLARHNQHQQDSVQGNSVSGTNLVADPSNNGTDRNTPHDPIHYHDDDNPAYSLDDDKDLPPSHNTPSNKPPMMQLSHFLHPHSSWTSARSSLRKFMVYGVGCGIEMVLSLQTVNKI